MRSRSRIASLLVFAALVAPIALQAAPAPLKVGEKPENFTLTAPGGKQYSLHVAEMPKATAVLFISARCPISNRYNKRMIGLADEYVRKGVRFLAINSNDPETMEEIDTHTKKRGYPFPVVKDPNNLVADRWGAQVTPEAFVLDPQGVLQYHGRIDDQWDERLVKSQDLKNALDAVLAGKKPEKPETQATGCDIKRI